MSCCRQSIYFQVFWQNFQFPYRLNCIRMKKYISLCQNFPNFLNWLNNSSFIIHKHYRNKCRIFPQFLLQFFNIHSSIFINANIRNFIPFIFQLLKSLQNRRMLNSRCYNMFPFTLIRLQKSPYHKIIPFGSARCKHNFSCFNL